MYYIISQGDVDVSVVAAVELLLAPACAADNDPTCEDAAVDPAVAVDKAGMLLGVDAFDEAPELAEVAAAGFTLRPGPAVE